MSLLRCAVLALQVSSIVALPSFNRRESGILSLPEVHTAVEERRSIVSSGVRRHRVALRQKRDDGDDSDDDDDDDNRRQRGGNEQGAGRGATPPPAATPPAAAPPAAAPPAAAPPAAAPPKEGGEGEKNEVVKAGTFGTAVELGGGNVKQDTEFTATLGKFEVEYQSNDANTLTVTETKTPAGKAPSGFQFLETSSFTVKLDKTTNTTLARIDYIFDAAKVAGVDVTKSAVGKLCTELGAFVVSEALGEAEFEADENEVVLNVKDLNGEFAVFIPTAATGVAPPAAAPGAGGGEGEEKKNEIDLTGQFNAAIAVAGGFSKQDILFPQSNAGSLEVEYNGTAANAILVTAKAVAENPPAGLVFVDGSTFTVRTQGAPAAGDQLKIDYIFNAAVKAAVADPSKGLIGKRDATGSFVTQGVGEFEFEAEEDEWSLTVPDLNGEWAIFVPRTAIAATAGRVN